MVEESGETDETTTVIAAMDVPLEGPIYKDVHAHVSLEVRDFGCPERTLVLRLWVEGQPYTSMVDWTKFTEAFDEMRASMMPMDWDDARSALGPGDAPT